MMREIFDARAPVTRCDFKPPLTFQNDYLAATTSLLSQY